MQRPSHRDLLCMQVSPLSLEVHVHSKEAPGLGAWCEGLIDAAARRYFLMQGLRMDFRTELGAAGGDGEEVGTVHEVGG